MILGFPSFNLSIFNWSTLWLLVSSLLLCKLLETFEI